MNAFPGGAQHVNIGIRQGVQQPQIPSQVSHSGFTLTTHCCFSKEPERLNIVCLHELNHFAERVLKAAVINNFLFRKDQRFACSDEPRDNHH